MNWSFIFVFIVSIIISVDLKQSDKFMCGVKFKSSELSANRTASEPNEWPWLASLHFLPSKQYICGGTIVSEHHVLTAAHCVDNKLERLKLDQILVYLGRHNLSSTAEKFEWFIPYQMLVHPDWEVSENRFDADIAVLIAAMPIPFSIAIAPICLWTDLSEDEDYVGTVVGWGEFGTRNISDVPNQLRVQRTSSARCYEDFFMIAAIASSRTFCAGGNQRNNVPCAGFSGGGFFVEENGVWFVQGIVSSTLLTGSNRCDASKYSLFTKIIEFLTWINVSSYQHEVFFVAYRSYELNIYRGTREMTPICLPTELSVRQPSGRVVTNSKKFTLDFRGLKVENQDTVYFPYGFGALYPNLTRVEIYESNLKFVDRKSFEDMNNVISMFIESNPISSIPHDTFFDLNSLELLMFEDCKLAKLHRDLFAKNLNLSQLSFKRNELESLPSDLLRNNLKLKDFRVSENRIKFINDRLFANLEHLETISFSNNFLQKISSKAFGDLSKLKEIYLARNRLKSLHVDIFSNNLNLEYFDIRFNQIAALKTGTFRNNSKLYQIYLDQNKVKHIDEKLLEDQTNLVLISWNGMSLLKLPVELFSTLTKIKFLAIQTNELTQLNDTLLRKNVNLISFKADFNKIENLHSSLFEKNVKLRTVTLSNNRIKNLAKGLFSNLAKLEKVDLSFNYIASISSDSFEGVVDLQLLVMNENSLDLEKQNSNREILPGRQKIFSSGTEYSEMETIDIMNNHSKLNETKIQEKHQRTDPSKCGRKLKSGGLIVNGTASGVNEWPWLTTFIRSPSKEFFCGGSIVSEHHVLTAAHCLHDKHRGQAVLKPTEFLVYLGKHNLSALEENSQWFHPHEVLVHPDWATDTIRYDADLAIVVSDLPIPFSSTIEPVCLWTELEEDGNYFGTVVGWGASEKTGLKRHTDVPYHVEVRRVPSEKCYEDQHLLAKIGSSRSFCARGVAEYSGPCNGDSGGGFIVKLNEVWYLRGIASSTTMSRTLTCDISKHALYTKINEFLPWINLRNKAYDIRLRGHLIKTKNEEDLRAFNSNGLAVTQPSANVILDWKNSMLKVDKVKISEENVFFLPNGFGRIFPTLKEFEVDRSNLRFVERENFEGMKDLRALTIHDNPLKNFPGDAFSELTGIYDLKVTKTQIVLLREDLFSNNFELIHLNLSSNQIESLPNDLFKNKTKLYTIDLSYNQIKFITAENFKNLESLERILLSNNRIQEISPQSFSTLKNLKIVQLDSNRIKNLLIDTFIQNQELTELDLASNLINDFPSSLLRKNLKLETLDLQSNKIKEFSRSDVSRTFLQSLKRLKVLRLDFMNIKVLPHDFFFDLTSVQIFSLSFNSIETLNKDLLTKNEQLTELYISFNKVQKISPTFFQRNLRLEIITINNNQLTSISSELFKNLTNLIRLELGFNLIESIEVDTFSDLTSLRELWLNDNNLKLLHENLFSKLKNLVYLEMASNQIEHLPTGLLRNNINLASIIFDYNNLKTIDIEFDPNRGYKHFLFFGNTCVNTGDIGDGQRHYENDIQIDVIKEIIKEILENCSDSK